MIDPAQLAGAFERNVNVVKMQSAGLSNDDSLIQLPFRGNCLNWVVGHITANRNLVLQALGEAPALGADATARYQRGSEPVDGGADGLLTLEELLETLERAQAGIAAGLQRASPDDLAREVPGSQNHITVGQRLFFLYFHETYHVGQTELLRQLAGKNDAVI